jgi:tetratricopeptide (TPR) repeat protein
MENTPTSKRMISQLGHLFHRFSKEFILAVILAVIAAVGYEWGKNWWKQEMLRRNLKAVAIIEVLDNHNKLIAQGSGFFINSTGLLATNAHVIKGAADVIAKLPSGAFYQLRSLRSVDDATDIAFLQFDGTETPSIRGIGNSDELQTGEKVFAIGNPGGLLSTVSEGNVSNPRRAINGKIFIQFTAPVSPGSSGGGLFIESGRVVGVTATFQKGEDNQNLNFAVPINDFKAVLSGQGNIVTGSPAFYVAQGSLEDNRREWDKAIAYYSQAIQLDPSYADAYIGLAGDYYEKAQYELEVKNYEKAVQFDPGNPDARYYLGTAYEDVGQFDKTIGQYLTTLKLDPNYKDALRDLALVYVARGNKSEAMKLIPQLAKLNPGMSQELQLIIQKQ